MGNVRRAIIQGGSCLVCERLQSNCPIGEKCPGDNCPGGNDPGINCPWGSYSGELARNPFTRRFYSMEAIFEKMYMAITFIFCTIKNYYGQSNFVNRIKSIFPKRTIDKSASIREVTYSIGVFRSLSNI